MDFEKVPFFTFQAGWASKAIVDFCEIRSIPERILCCLP
jgi:hypothetical protein